MSSGAKASGGNGRNCGAASAGATAPLPPTTPRPTTLKRNARSQSAEDYGVFGAVGVGVGGMSVGEEQHNPPAACSLDRRIGSYPLPLSPSDSRRPPRAGCHRSCRSDGSITAFIGTGSSINGSIASSGGSDGLPPAARNLALDFFPESHGGKLRPRIFVDGNNNCNVDAHRAHTPLHPLIGHDDPSSAASSFYSRNDDDDDHHHHKGASIGEVDDASSIGSRSDDGSSIYSHSDIEYSAHEEEGDDDDDDDDGDSSYESEEEYDHNDYVVHSEKLALVHQSILSASHSLDEGQLDDIFRHDGHYDARKEIPRATEIYGSSTSLAHATRGSTLAVASDCPSNLETKNQQQQQLLLSQYLSSPLPHKTNYPGPPPLIETPGSDSPDRKQVATALVSPTKDETLSDLSNLSGNVVPRTVFYTPQVTPDAKAQPSVQGQPKSSRQRRNTEMSKTPLSLNSLQSAKIDFLCYGRPEEVPDEDEYCPPLSPCSYFNTSALDEISTELEGANRRANVAGAPESQIVSPSPPNKQRSSPPKTPGTLYTVEDIVRASASAISRVLNLSHLSSKVDDNMEEITKQTYEILQSNLPPRHI